MVISSAALTVPELNNTILRVPSFGGKNKTGR
jgi:hypothetical protein